MYYGMPNLQRCKPLNIYQIVLNIFTFTSSTIFKTIYISLEKRDRKT